MNIQIEVPWRITQFNVAFVLKVFDYPLNALQHNESELNRNNSDCLNPNFIQTQP